MLSAADMSERDERDEDEGGQPARRTREGAKEESDRAHWGTGTGPGVVQHLHQIHRLALSLSLPLTPQLVTNSIYFVVLTHRLAEKQSGGAHPLPASERPKPDPVRKSNLLHVDQSQGVTTTIFGTISTSNPHVRRDSASATRCDARTFVSNQS